MSRARCRLALLSRIASRMMCSAKVGAKAVTFHVDPGILGGLIIKVGDKVLDGSVSGKLEGLKQNLK